MTHIAEAIAQELLDHHRHRCIRVPSPPIDACVVTYGDLCDRAGVPGVTRGVGRFLQEVAEWCHENGWPPLNSLAVNADLRHPGDSYDLAPGCSLLTWPDEVAACIGFRGYPETVG